MENMRLSSGAIAYYRGQISLHEVTAPDFVMPEVDAASEAELRALATKLVVKRFSGAVANHDDDSVGSMMDFAVAAADGRADNVAFALDRDFQGLTMCDMGTCKFLCRIGKGRPFHVFKLGGGENSGSPSEASAAELKRLSKALGIKHASPAELVAVLIAVIDPEILAAPQLWNGEAFYDYDDRYFTQYGDLPGADKVPVLAEAIAKLGEEVEDV